VEGMQSGAAILAGTLKDEIVNIFGE